MNIGMRHETTGRRKTFWFALCALLVAIGLFAEAQQPKKIPRVGVLIGDSASSSAARIDAFRQGLRDLGYVEGQSIGIEYRYAEGLDERFSNLVAELVQLKVDIIITSGTPATQTAKNATKIIPIVMTNVADPIGAGLVASLAHPGGNIRGMSTLFLGGNNWNYSRKHSLKFPVWPLSGVRRQGGRRQTRWQR